MAKVTITIEDAEDGESINVTFQSDPPMPLVDGKVDVNKTTTAQNVAGAAMVFMGNLRDE